MRRPVLNVLRVPVGRPERIGSRLSIYNIGQCKGMHEKHYRSARVKLSVSGAGRQFRTLANAKACAKCITDPGGPTWAHRKQKQFYGIGQYEGMHKNILYVHIGQAERIVSRLSI